MSFSSSLPGPRPPRLSVIIVSWNTRDALLRCLRSIRAHEGIGDYETIVVDNHSTDGSAEAAATAFPGLKIIANEANVGFGAANNQAMALARGRYFLLLNSDTEIVEATFDAMAGALDRFPWAGAVGCRLRREDGRQQISAGPLPGLLPILLSAVGLHRLFPRSPLFPTSVVMRQAARPVQPVGYVSGACLMLRRRAVEESGAFDPAFFLYSEETDLCRRLADAGWSVLYMATPTVVHAEGGSQRGAGPERLLRLATGTIRYLIKHGGPAARVLSVPVVFLHLAARTIGGGVPAGARLRVLSRTLGAGFRLALGRAE